MANDKRDDKNSKPVPPSKETEIEPLSDAALEEVAGGGDPTGSPLCGPPDIV